MSLAAHAKSLLPLSWRDVLRPYWNRIALPGREERLRKREIATFGAAQRWQKVQADEIAFWEDQLRACPMPRMKANRPLQPHIMELIEAPPNSRVEILDVGAGPMTILGDQWAEREISITAIDPNAAEYDQILAKRGITPPCRTRFGYAEDLWSVAPTSFFDLVHARNCIDHGRDPMKAIEQMVQAAKPGCCVFLNHYIAEGRRNEYSGPHQWNLFPEHGRFYIDRPGLHPIDVGEKLEGTAYVSIGRPLMGPESFTVTIRRRL